MAFSRMGAGSPEQEIERLRIALALARIELTRLTRENMDLAALIHHAGLDGEPMAPLVPPAPITEG